MLDFTLEQYQRLCRVLLENDFSPTRVVDYFHLGKRELEHFPKVVILRHDVDRKLGNALQMAKLEAEMGIASTFYFRYPYTFEPPTIRLIQGLGHEVGYHYEVLAKAQGKPEMAIRLFQTELNSMRLVTEIRTICMHGSPLSRHDNRDLWKFFDYRDFGIEGEAFLSLEGTNYYTDTGRSWNSTNSMRDRMPESDQAFRPETTDDLIDLIASGITDTIYLNTHPERWSNTRVDYLSGILRDFSFNMGKKILMRARS